MIVDSKEEQTSLGYFSKMPQVRTLHARLCSDLAYVLYSSHAELAAYWGIHSVR